MRKLGTRNPVFPKNRVSKISLRDLGMLYSHLHYYQQLKIPTSGLDGGEGVEGGEGNNQLTITNYQLPTTNYPLPIQT
ncbi:MAG: hypothetical protein AAF630_03915 [Cyanobacteria bacterium P01_C01_bin.38]